MSRRPSRSFVICLIAFSTVGATGAWAWSRANSIPNYERAKLGFLRSVFYQEETPEDRSFPTAEDRARNRGATDALVRQLRDEYPALKTEAHPVPEAENGFYQMYCFGKDHETPKSPTQQELQGLLEGERWGADEARRLLDRNADIVTCIEALASMEKRSSTDLPEDYHGFLPARGIFFAAHVLLLKAYVAAESHEEPEALRLTQGALNLSAHLRQVEARNLLGESVATRIELTVNQVVFQRILPALGRDANLPEWKKALAPHDHSPADFAQLMRGEWENTMRYYVLPVFVDHTNRNRPPDADRLARILTSHYSAFITRLPETSLATMHPRLSLAVRDDLKSFSKKSRDIYDSVLVGSENWGKGYFRAAVIVAQHQAALDLLILEKQGVTLNRESATGVSRDPLTEKPFDFDPASRTLTASHDRQTLPLKLPW